MVPRRSVPTLCSRERALASTALSLFLCLASAGVVIASQAIEATAPQAHELATDVAGAITKDTTWTRAGSPYRVTGQVAVPVGVTYDRTGLEAITQTGSDHRN